MARLTERLKALEMVKRVLYGMPLIIIVKDEGLTERQKVQTDEAEKEGQKVVKIIRDKN